MIFSLRNEQEKRMFFWDEQLEGSKSFHGANPGRGKGEKRALKKKTV